MSEPFLGEIRLFGFNFAPRGWATCSGQLMSIAQNTALFALVGTYYGGDGRVTFGLPDLRGRSAVGQGQGPGLENRVLGELAGSEQATLLATNLPSHSHPVAPPVAANATTKNPAGAVPGLTSGAAYSATATGTGASYVTGLTGGQQPFSIRSPYLVGNYCIALQGIFPSRN